MMMTTSASSSKQIRHAKLLAESIELADSPLDGQKLMHNSKRNSKSTQLIDTSHFDSKSFINKSDGFTSSIEFKAAGNNSSSVNGKKGMVPIIIVSKGKKLINKYQLDDASKSKIDYIKSLNKNEIKLNQKQFIYDYQSNSNFQINSARENNFDNLLQPHLTKSKNSPFKVKVGLIKQNFS